MIYYHGTTSLNAERIKKDGISPNNSKYAGKIYLTTNYGEASKYAKIASDGKPGKVLKIHSDKLNPEHVYSNNSGIIEYKGSIHPQHISEETNVGMIAGSGDFRLPVDQREPGININIKNNKKILRRKKLNLDEDYLNSLSLEELEALVENIDQLDELSKDTLKSYIHRAMDNKDENQKRAEKLGKLAIDLDNSGIGSSFNSLERKFRTRFRNNDDARDQENKKRELSSELSHRRYMADKEVANRKRGINQALRKLTKEDYNEINGALINTVINESPSDFYNLFSDIIYSKINDYVDSMKEDVAYDLFESGRLNELSGATLGNYIMKARNYLGKVKVRNMKPGDFEKNNKRARGIDRAGSKLFGGDYIYGDEINLKHTKPKVKASIKEDNRLNELSKETLLNYIQAANHSGHADRVMQMDHEKDATYYNTGRRSKDKDFYRDQSSKKAEKFGRKAYNRQMGVDTAIKKLMAKDQAGK